MDRNGDLPKVIVDFKKKVYENLLIELKKYFNSRFKNIDFMR